MNHSLRSSRRAFLAGSALGTLALNAPAIARQGISQPSAWPQLSPPRPPRIPNLIEQLGRERDDPYAWMKYVPQTGARSPETLPEPVGRMLASENAYAKAMLAPVEDERDALLAAMMARAAGGVNPPPLRRGGWEYSAAIPPGALHPVHIRRREGGPAETVLDETERASGQSYYRSTDHQPSPDHRYFAWAEDVIGNDRHRIVVLDTESGTTRTLVERDAYGYGALTFSPSSRWLFWIWRDRHNRPTRLYRTAVDGSATELVYEESDPAIFMSLRRTAADGFVALTLSGPEVAEVRLIAAGAETAPPRVVLPRSAGVVYEIDEWDGSLVAVTDRDGAFDRKIERLDPETFETLETLVPHRAGRPIVSVLPFRKALVRLERVDGLHRIVLLKPDGTELPLAFDDPAYAVTLPAGQDYNAGQVMIVHQSPRSPRRWILVDLDRGTRQEVRRETAADFDPEDYEVERLFALAPDGERVPITVLSRKGTPRDGSAPLLLYGYGAYGVSSDPEFSIPASVLVDKGWRYAIAHVRGGGELGQRWFLGGRRFHKRNSFTDFIACATHLAREGYSAPGRIVAYGLSAGGLLVGASMNMAPGLWGGVIAKVPFVDMLNTMSDADHPLVPLFRPDWGDPLADPAAYDYIASISPYENVRRAAYPPLLCTAGLKDDRVAYWEPAKLVAQVRHLSTSGNPAMLLTDMHAGHQGSADMRSEFSEMALFWAFAQRCVADGEAG